MKQNPGKTRKRWDQGPMYNMRLMFGRRRDTFSSEKKREGEDDENFRMNMKARVQVFVIFH